MGKGVFCILLLSVCGVVAQAQSPTKNYILGRQMLDANGSQAITTISYYDDFGNEDEVATTGLGGQGKYAYTKKEYSVPGQVVKEWIPGATSSDGGYLDAPSFISSSCSFFKDSYPFVTNEYDALGRVVSTMQPGANWANAHRAVRKCYGTNAENSVRKYVVSSSGALEQAGFYAPGALSLEMTIDEDGNTLQVFTDVVGRKMLERRADSNDTYCIYDDLGLLRFVLSPSYQEEANLEKYGYEYRYDQRGRCVWKRLPGCEYQQLWYDNADNLMFSQNGEQRRKGIYVFHLYDHVKRLVLQGTTTAVNADCPSALVSLNVSEAGLCNSGYSSPNSLGLRNEQLLQANYYDNHNFLSGQLARQVSSHSLAANQITKEEYSMGSLTGSVSADTNGNPLVSVYYHDMRGQVIESKQTMPDDALLSQTMSYSFTKKLLSIVSTINKDGVIMKVTQSNTYNEHNDKIETMTLQVGNITRTVASYSYDDIGRVVSVNRSGNAGSVHHTYNIRNWLKETKSDGFMQSLYYETDGENPCFNGNISRMQWQSTKDDVLRGYDFTYDRLNRLEKSDYGEGADFGQNKGHYSERVLSYSPNGSIERLQRYGKKNNGGFGLIDDLTYQYNGNQIESISDKAGSLLYDGSFDFKDGADEDVEYFYDANGALVKDLNKGVSNIEYDVLGNLKCITFNNGFKTKYIYDAAGNKLRTIHESVVTNTTDYTGNFIFEDGKLDKYLFDGGYCSFDDNQNPTFHYYEKDHLGSVRMVVNENGTIGQVNHYYPFGGVYGDLSYKGEYQKSKYIGKEFDHMHGLDWYDHGARMYDAAKVAWDRVDRFGEKYYHLSPYLYCGNNSTYYADFTGDSISLSWIVKIDKILHEDFAQTIIDDWQTLTGLTLSINENGNVVYNKNTDGSASVSTSHSNGKTVQKGSLKAREFLIRMIDGVETIYFSGGKITANLPGTNDIGINYKQIQSFISGTSNGLDSRTLGWGMVLFHEMLHTNVGGRLKDDMANINSTGPVVDFMNDIREEMNKQGYNFGKRKSYLAIPYGNNYRIMFNNGEYVEF